MKRLREIAKFACGVEAFHAFTHAVLWFTGGTLTVFGITASPTWNIVSAIGNGAVSIILGIFAWQPFMRRMGAPSAGPQVHQNR